MAAEPFPEASRGKMGHRGFLSSCPFPGASACKQNQLSLLVAVVLSAASCISCPPCSPSAFSLLAAASSAPSPAAASDAESGIAAAAHPAYSSAADVIAALSSSGADAAAKRPSLPAGGAKRQLALQEAAVGRFLAWLWRSGMGGVASRGHLLRVAVTPLPQPAPGVPLRANLRVSSTRAIPANTRLLSIPSDLWITPNATRVAASFAGACSSLPAPFSELLPQWFDLALQLQGEREKGQDSAYSAWLKLLPTDPVLPLVLPPAVLAEADYVPFLDLVTGMQQAVSVMAAAAAESQAAASSSSSSSSSGDSRVSNLVAAALLNLTALAASQAVGGPLFSSPAENVSKGSAHVAQSDWVGLAPLAGFIPVSPQGQVDFKANDSSLTLSSRVDIPHDSPLSFRSSPLPSHLLLAAVGEVTPLSLYDSTLLFSSIDDIILFFTSHFDQHATARPVASLPTQALRDVVSEAAAAAAAAFPSLLEKAMGRGRGRVEGDEQEREAIDRIVAAWEHQEGATASEHFSAFQGGLVSPRLVAAFAALAHLSFEAEELNFSNLPLQAIASEASDAALFSFLSTVTTSATSSPPPPLSVSSRVAMNAVHISLAQGLASFSSSYDVDVKCFEQLQACGQSESVQGVVKTTTTEGSSSDLQSGGGTAAATAAAAESDSKLLLTSSLRKIGCSNDVMAWYHELAAAISLRANKKAILLRAMLAVSKGGKGEWVVKGKDADELGATLWQAGLGEGDSVGNRTEAGDSKAEEEVEEEEEEEEEGEDEEEEFGFPLMEKKQKQVEGQVELSVKEEMEQAADLIQWLRSNGVDGLDGPNSTVQIAFDPTTRLRDVVVQVVQRAEAATAMKRQGGEGGASGETALSDSDLKRLTTRAESRMLANRNFAAGDVILRIPRNMTMSSFDSVNRDVAWAGSIWSYSPLAAWLLREKGKGLRSSWWPYLRLLPASVPLPFLFAEDVRDEIGYRPLLFQINQLLQHLSQEYNTFDQQQIAFASHADFLWAISILLSHSHAIPPLPAVAQRVAEEGIEVDGENPTLIPLLDLAKRAVQSNSQIEFTDDFVQLIASKPLTNGSEVLLPIRPDHNDFIFFSLGASPPDNPLDAVPMFVNMEQVLGAFLRHLRPAELADSWRQGQGKELLLAVGERMREEMVEQKRRWFVEEGREEDFIHRVEAPAFLIWNDQEVEPLLLAALAAFQSVVADTEPNFELLARAAIRLGWGSTNLSCAAIAAQDLSRFTHNPLLPPPAAATDAAGGPQVLSAADLASLQASAQVLSAEVQRSLDFFATTFFDDVSMLQTVFQDCFNLLLLPEDVLLSGAYETRCQPHLLLWARELSEIVRFRANKKRILIEAQDRLTLACDPSFSFSLQGGSLLRPIEKSPEAIVDELVAWMNSRGANVSADENSPIQVIIEPELKLSAHMRDLIAKQPGYISLKAQTRPGFGMRAGQAAASNTSIVSVPRNLWLDSTVMGEESAPPYNGPVESTSILSAFLLREKAKGEGSEWAPYINSLPSYVPLLFTFDDKVLKEMQMPVVAKLVELSRGEMLREYRRCQPAAIAFASLTEFTWAYVNVLSRTFVNLDPTEEVSDLTDASMEKLFVTKRGGSSSSSNKGRKRVFRGTPQIAIPFIDFMNHMPTDNNVTWTFDDEGFNFVSVKPLNKGDPIYTSYGHKSNTILLRLYGFALQDNSYERVWVFNDLVEAVRYVCTAMLDPDSAAPFQVDPSAFSEGGGGRPAGGAGGGAPPSSEKRLMKRRVARCVSTIELGIFDAVQKLRAELTKPGADPQMAGLATDSEPWAIMSTGAINPTLLMALASGVFQITHGYSPNHEELAPVALGVILAMEPYASITKSYIASNQNIGQVFMKAIRLIRSKVEEDAKMNHITTLEEDEKIMSHLKQCEKMQESYDPTTVHEGQKMCSEETLVWAQELQLAVLFRMEQKRIVEKFKTAYSVV